MNYWLNLSDASKIAESIVKRFGMDVFPSANHFFNKLDAWLEKHYPDFTIIDFEIELEVDQVTGEAILVSVKSL